HISSGVERVLRAPADLYERERRYRHKDGRTVWARVLRVPVRDAEQRLRYIVAVLVDITAQHQAEVALRQERDFCDQVLETADAPIGALAPDGRIRRFNGKCVAVTGYRADEAAGRLVWDLLVPPAQRDACRADFERLDEDDFPGVREGAWTT